MLVPVLVQYLYVGGSLLERVLEVCAPTQNDKSVEPVKSEMSNPLDNPLICKSTTLVLQPSLSVRSTNPPLEMDSEVYLAAPPRVGPCILSSPEKTTLLEYYSACHGQL